jgi:transcriptional regulator with XRE-family HTH domain
LVTSISIDSGDDIVEFIERQRVRLGMSQRKLCSEAGLSHGAYWFVKNGSGLHLETALRLLEAVGAEMVVEIEP